MARLYSVQFSAVTETATQDIFNLTATSGMAFRLKRIELGQTTISSWSALQLKLIRHTGTVTAGSGGSTPTPSKFNNGDAAATVTAHANDTTAMSSTTPLVLFDRAWELLNGFFWVPASASEEIVIAPSQGLALNMPGTPASMSASGYIVFEELF